MNPAQQYPPAYLAEDRGWELIKVVITFGVLVTVFVSLFFVSRTLNKTLNGLDVYLMLPAYIFCFGNIIISLLLVKYGGTGRHVVALSPGTLLIWLKLGLTEQYVYMLSITLPKLAILCLYERVFTTKFYRHWITITAAIIVLTLISSAITTFTICRPFKYTWDKTIPGGKCANQMASYRYISVPNLLTDAIMLILPLHVVWNLQMGIAHRVGLTVTFMAGCIGIITSIVRFVSFFHMDLLEDPTFDSVKSMTWSVVEPSVYLIAATLPSLRPLIRRIFKDVNYGRFFTRLQSYCIRVFSMQRETDNVPLVGAYGSSSMKNATANGGASGGTTTVGFKRLEDSTNQQYLLNGGDEGGAKTLHTYRERYEREGGEDKLW